MNDLERRIRNLEVLALAMASTLNNLNNEDVKKDLNRFMDDFCETLNQESVNDIFSKGTTSGLDFRKPEESDPNEVG